MAPIEGAGPRQRVVPDHATSGWTNSSPGLRRRRGPPGSPRRPSPPGAWRSKSERYWFWTGVGSKETLAGNWRRTFRRLCEIAGVRDGHPHRFRDTLAIELLLDGVPMDRVSILLGHFSVKIAERHYAPWVQARQVQLEADVTRAWRNDPIAQVEMLKGDTAPADVAPVRMAATYPRHENEELANQRKTNKLFW